MTRCPLCKARYRGQTECRRCRADLHTLQALEDDAGHQAHKAVQQLLAGNGESAEYHARKAAKKHGDRFNTLLYGFIMSINRDDR